MVISGGFLCQTVNGYKLFNRESFLKIAKILALDILYKRKYRGLLIINAHNNTWDILQAYQLCSTHSPFTADYLKKSAVSPYTYRLQDTVLPYTLRE